MKSTKKLLALLTSIVLMGTMMVGCAEKAPVAEETPVETENTAETPTKEPTEQTEPEKETTSAPPSGDPIKIGYVSALSGDTALWGQAGLNGMMMTAENINLEGGVLGRPLEIIGLDGMGQPMDSVNAFNQLIDKHEVVAVVGTNFSNCNIAMAPIANEREIPLIGTATSGELVTVDENGKLHPYSFRIGFIDSFQGKLLAKYTFEEMGIQNAAMIFDIGDSYSSGIADVIEKEYMALGGNIVTKEQIRSGDNDFRAQLTKIIEKKPEAIFAPLVYKDVALVARQAKELGFEGIMIGADGWDSKELPTLAEGALEGAIFCSRPGFATPEAAAYGEEYKERYKIGLESECLFGNDGVMWLAQVMEEAGSADPKAIRDGLENTTNFDGLIGKMSVDPATHNPDREAAIFRIEGTENIFVEMYQ